MTSIKKLPLKSMLINLNNAIKPFHFIQFLSNNDKFNKKEKDNGKIKKLCMGPYHR